MSNQPISGGKSIKTAVVMSLRLTIVKNYRK
jgi:hypothetical protein